MAELIEMPFEGWGATEPFVGNVWAPRGEYD